MLCIHTGLSRSVSSVCTILHRVLGVVFQNSYKRNWFLSHGKTMWSVSSSTSCVRMCVRVCTWKPGSITPNLGDMGNRQLSLVAWLPCISFYRSFYTQPSSSLVLRYATAPKHLIRHSDDRHSWCICTKTHNWLVILMWWWCLGTSGLLN